MACTGVEQRVESWESQRVDYLEMYWAVEKDDKRVEQKEHQTADRSGTMRAD